MAQYDSQGGVDYNQPLPAGLADIPSASVGVELETVDRGFSVLVERLGILVAKLEPILRPTEPMAGGEAPFEAKVVRAEPSAVVAELRSHRDRIDAQIAFVQQVIDRLEV